MWYGLAKSSKGGALATSIYLQLCSDFSLFTQKDKIDVAVPYQFHILPAKEETALAQFISCFCLFSIYLCSS